MGRMFKSQLFGFSEQLTLGDAAVELSNYLV
jgi:hypothetical protein